MATTAQALLRANVRARLARRGIAEATFSASLGRSKSWLNSLLNEQRGKTLRTLDDLARGLDIPVAALFAPLLAAPEDLPPVSDPDLLKFLHASAALLETIAPESLTAFRTLVLGFVHEHTRTRPFVRADHQPP